MTRIKQKEFEKIFTDVLIVIINKRESNNINFLRYGNEGKETDLIYQDSQNIIGIEVFGHYQSVRKGGRSILLKLTNRNYSKGDDIIEFLETQIKVKTTKYYQPVRKWLLCVNRFAAVSPEDFYQIFLSNYHNGWGNFERIFVIFDKYQTRITKYDIFECYEIEKKTSKLILLGAKTLKRPRKSV